MSLIHIIVTDRFIAVAFLLIMQTFQDKLKNIALKYKTLEKELSSPKKFSSNEFAELAKQYSDLEPVYVVASKYLKLLSEIEETEKILNSNDSDSELIQFAQEEKIVLKKELLKTKEDLQFILLPKDEDDEKNVILEVRAGTGGEEAALFVADLFRMYQKYSDIMGWKIEILSTSNTGLKGYKEIISSIKGKNVYKNLKYESGVHRVQRIPYTETNGRIHTSAVTVAVLPEVQDVDLHIKDNDIRIDVYRGSGAGGQHVNTTDSAVRITHIPTGITVVQAEKSQHQNKAKALKILRSRLYQIEKRKKDEERSKTRKTQVGSGDRSERIRTYNYPQGRMTDHRINLNIYNLEEILNEGLIQELINALIADDNAKKLSESE